MAERTYEVVLFGATGYTGRLTAEYLARSAPPDLRWAIAGRNADKLREVRDALVALSPHCRDLPIVVAASDDPVALRAMASSTKVVLTTVGPYARHGEPLVAACVECGTDYVDITGEPQFVADVIARYDAPAREKRIRVVSCCGLDSIPSDIGVYFTVAQLPAGVPLRIEGFVRMSGGISGGTWNSALEAFADRRALATRKERADTGARKVHGIRGRIHFAPEVQRWVAPFPSIDPQVVLRSARTLDRYGPDFSYGHYVQFKSLPQLAVMVGGAGGAFLLAQFRPTRTLLASLRRPGEGPSAEDRARGRLELKFVGEGGGQRVRTYVRAGDPGYGETAKMVSESALCLARDADSLPQRFGVLTTAEAMGDRLLARLRAAGMEFGVES